MQFFKKWLFCLASCKFCKFLQFCGLRERNLCFFFVVCFFRHPESARSDAPGFGWCGLFSFSPWSSKMSRLSWECACTFTNDVDAVFCSCCDAPKPRTEASVEAPENLQAASEGEQRSKRPRVTRELTFKESAERVAEVLSSPAYGRFGNIFSPPRTCLAS